MACWLIACLGRGGHRRVAGSMITDQAFADSIIDAISRPCLPQPPGQIDILHCPSNSKLGADHLPEIPDILLLHWFLFCFKARQLRITSIMLFSPTLLALSTLLSPLGVAAVPWRGRPNTEVQPAAVTIEAAPPPAPSLDASALPAPAPAAQDPAPAPAPAAPSAAPPPPPSGEQHDIKVSHLAYHCPSPATSPLILYCVLDTVHRGRIPALTVQLINYCPSGTPVFKFDTDRNPSGSRLITGPLDSGRTWLQGGEYGCEPANGQNCGQVEFHCSTIRDSAR